MWGGQHMHHNSAIKIFRPLNHHPPALHQVHQQIWPAYMTADVGGCCWKATNQPVNRRPCLEQVTRHLIHSVPAQFSPYSTSEKVAPCDAHSVREKKLMLRCAQCSVAQGSVGCRVCVSLHCVGLSGANEATSRCLCVAPEQKELETEEMRSNAK